MSKKVSIILPVYNREKTISATIESVLSQTYKSWELIIIDDGSNDRSNEICYNYTIKDSRVQLFKKENGGPSQARNYGIEISNGDYLMFIDSDDRYEANAVEKMVNTIINYKSDVVICNYNGRCKINSFINKKVSENCIDILQKNYLFNILWNKIYLLEIIKKNKISFDENIEIGEDYRFNVDYFKYINNITYISQSLYKYNSSCDGLTKKNRKNEFDVSISNLEYNIKIFLQNNIHISSYLKDQYLKLSKVSICTLVRLKLDKKTIKNEIEKIRNFLKKENVLNENMLNFKTRHIENNIFRIMIKYKMFNTLIVYSFFRNYIKKILK